jgi:hypothetical protein
LDDNTGECSLADDCDSDDDYTQLVTPGIHTVPNWNSGNDDEQRTVMCVDEQGVGMGGVSMKLVWQDISMLYAV